MRFLSTRLVISCVLFLTVFLIGYHCGRVTYAAQVESEAQECDRCPQRKEGGVTNDPSAQVLEPPTPVDTAANTTKFRSFFEAPSRSSPRCAQFYELARVSRQRKGIMKLEADALDNPTSYVAAHFGAKFPFHKIASLTSFYSLALSCAMVVKMPGSHTVSESAYWNKRAGDTFSMSHHPILTPMHGGVSPHRVIRQGLHMAEYLDVRKWGVVLPTSTNSLFAPPANGPPSEVVIVDLGCGNGALLAAMCPPIDNMYCYGTDFADSLIQNAQKFLPHIDFRVGKHAPHLPDGVADAVLSHAVIPLLTPNETCHHIEEALRLLKGGGRLVLWMVSTMWHTLRIHPTFFASPKNGTEKDIGGESAATATFLPSCVGLSSYVSKVQIIPNDKAPIYSCTLEVTGWYGILLTRSDVPYQEGSAVASSLTPELKRRHASALDSANETKRQYYDALTKGYAIRHFRGLLSERKNWVRNA